MLIFIYLLYALMGYNNSPYPTTPAHPIKVSITTIEHNPKEQSIQMTMKVFTDDLKAAIEDVMKPPEIYFGSDNAEKYDQTTQHVQRYIEDRFTMTINKQDTSYTFLGMETELELTWIYMELSPVAKLHHLKIGNQILTQTFENQQNIVHVYYRNHYKSLVFRKGTPPQELTWHIKASHKETP